MQQVRAGFVSCTVDEDIEQATLPLSQLKLNGPRGITRFQMNSRTRRKPTSELFFKVISDLQVHDNPIHWYGSHHQWKSLLS